MKFLLLKTLTSTIQIVQLSRGKQDRENSENGENSHHGKYEPNYQTIFDNMRFRGYETETLYF